MTITQFLYQGEANVYQENLDSFLAIAEELQLKGLYENQTKAVPKENLPPEIYARTATSLSEEGVYSVDESHKPIPSKREPIRGRPYEDHSQTRDGKRKAKREQKKVARIEKEREKLVERQARKVKAVENAKCRIEKEREKLDERQARKVKAAKNAKERAWRSELFSRGLATDDQVMFLSVSFKCWSM